MLDAFESPPCCATGAKRLCEGRRQDLAILVWSISSLAMLRSTNCSSESCNIHIVQAVTIGIGDAKHDTSAHAETQTCALLVGCRHKGCRVHWLFKHKISGMARTLIKHRSDISTRDWSAQPFRNKCGRCASHRSACAPMHAWRIWFCNYTARQHSSLLRHDFYQNGQHKSKKHHLGVQGRCHSMDLPTPLCNRAANSSNMSGTVLVF